MCVINLRVCVHSYYNGFCGWAGRGVMETTALGEKRFLSLLAWVHIVSEPFRTVLVLTGSVRLNDSLGKKDFLFYQTAIDWTTFDAKLYIAVSNYANFEYPCIWATHDASAAGPGEGSIQLEGLQSVFFWELQMCALKHGSPQLQYSTPVNTSDRQQMNGRSGGLGSCGWGGSGSEINVLSLAGESINQTLGEMQ